MPKSKLRPPAKTNRTRPPDALDLMDEAVASCRAIEVLARLLEMAGATDELDGALASETGWTIRRHAKNLHQTLNTLKNMQNSRSAVGP